jgi:hypothetical protein
MVQWFFRLDMNNNLKKLRVYKHFIVAVHRPSHKVVRAFFLTRNYNFIRFDGMFVRFFKSHIFAPSPANSVSDRSGAQNTNGTRATPLFLSPNPRFPILSETRSFFSNNSQLRHAPFLRKFSPTSKTFDVRLL